MQQHSRSLPGRVAAWAGERATQSSRAIAGELRLGVDHIDLLQHHKMLRFDDPGRIFA